MNGKIGSRLTAAFYAAFSGTFLFLFLQVLLLNRWYFINTWKAFLSMLFWGAVLFAITRVVALKKELSCRRAGIFVVSVLLIVLGIQLSLGYWFRIRPAFDVDAIYRGAITWNQTGFLGNYMQYFCTFPNNLGGMLLLSLTFRLADVFGFTDYNAVATVLNCFLINCSFLLVFLICEKLFGLKRALCAFLFSVLCLPLLFYAPVFYTDTLSICFPALAYYLYLRAKETASSAKRAVLFALMGAAIAVGTVIKLTVLIMLIAIFIDLLLSGAVKRCLLPCLMSAAIVVASFAGMHVFQSRNLIGTTYREQNIPYTHWIMMGLNGVGSYNSRDYFFTRFFPNIEAKENADEQEIKTRIQQYTPVTFAKHLAKKATYQFGSGLYAVNTMLDDNPQHRNWFHPYITNTDPSDKTRFVDFSSFTQGYHLLLLLLTALSGFAALRNRAGRNFSSPAPRLAVAGLLLFLIMWESNSRYLVNYLPVLVVCAFSGMDVWDGWLRKITECVRNRSHGSAHNRVGSCHDAGVSSAAKASKLKPIGELSFE